MPELLSVLVDIPKVPSRIRTGGFLLNQAGAGILYGGSRRLREGRCCRHTSIPKIHGMIYVLRLKDILYIMRDRRVTNVERMLSNLTKSEKSARKTHFCKTNGVVILDEIHRRYSEDERDAKARQITERNHAKSPNEIASNHRM